MILYLRAKVEELGVSYHQFFEMAHYWQFQRYAQCNDDYCQFLLHGVLPKYVVAFIHHLQEKETCTSSTANAPSAQGTLFVSPSVPPT